MEARLICDEPGRGDWNMAVDEMLLEAARQADRPVLRFYRWSSPTLSLGYFQGLAERRAHGASASCPLVRRASGGGAILHDRELTYSFVVRDEGIGGHRALYDAFHETLVEVLADWGILGTLFSAAGVAGKPEAASPFLCFQRRAEGDVLVEGAKVCGSAQRRHRGAILQHGSVLLRQSPQAPELPGLLELTGFELEPDVVRERWCARLSARLAVNWRIGPLSTVEIERALSVQSDKFGSESWTGRRA